MTVFGMLVTMYRYTRYYVNESGPVYRASFRVRRGNGIGSSFIGSSVLLNLPFIQGLKLS